MNLTNTSLSTHTPTVLYHMRSTKKLVNTLTFTLKQASAIMCGRCTQQHSTGGQTTLGSSPVELDLDKWNYNLDWETTGAVHCFGFFASAIGIVLIAFVMGELFVI